MRSSGVGERGGSGRIRKRRLISAWEEGRGACRIRGWISVGAGSLKKKEGAAVVVGAGRRGVKKNGGDVGADGSIKKKLNRSNVSANVRDQAHGSVVVSSAMATR